MAVVNTKSRAPAIIGLAALLVFIIALLHNQSSNIAAVTHVDTHKIWPFKNPDHLGSDAAAGFDGLAGEMPPPPPPPPALQPGHASSAIQDEPTWYELARKHGTDKVTTHSYHDMYQLHLPARRHKRTKMLEIGLGCNMDYGPGKSYALWLEYFTDVDLYYIEYDAKCAETWAHKTSRATVVTGDQGNVTFLENFIAEHGRDFDIIIDDGGHTMDQQKTSLQHLWKAVKPGGVYFCEDLQTSFDSNYGGAEAAKKAGVPTMMEYIYVLHEDLTIGPRKLHFEEVEMMYHIDCSREICGFFKRHTGEIGT